MSAFLWRVGILAALALILFVGYCVCRAAGLADDDDEPWLCDCEHLLSAHEVDADGNDPCVSCYCPGWHKVADVARVWALDRPPAEAVIDEVRHG